MRVTQKACGIYEEYAKVRPPLGEISPGLSRDDVVCVCSERPFSVLDVNLVTEKGNMGQPATPSGPLAGYQN